MAYWKEYDSPSEAPSTARDELTKILEEKRNLKEKMVQSTKNTLGMLVETEEVGAKTGAALYHQGQQLEKINDDLDAIDSNLKVTQRHLKSMSSFFSRVKNKFNKSGKEVQVKSSSVEEKPIPNYENIVQESKIAKSKKTYAGTSVEDELDEEVNDNLDQVDNILAKLKFMAVDFGSEIERQNGLIESATNKSDRNQLTLEGQNKQMGKLLK